MSELSETNSLVTTLHDEMQELERQRVVDLDKYLDSYTALEVKYFAAMERIATLERLLKARDDNMHGQFCPYAFGEHPACTCGHDDVVAYFKEAGK